MLFESQNYWSLQHHRNVSPGKPRNRFLVEDFFVVNWNFGDRNVLVSGVVIVQSVEHAFFVKDRIMDVLVPPIAEVQSSHELVLSVD